MSKLQCIARCIIQIAHYGVRGSILMETSSIHLLNTRTLVVGLLDGELAKFDTRAHGPVERVMVRTTKGLRCYTHILHLLRRETRYTCLVPDHGLAVLNQFINTLVLLTEEVHNGPLRPNFWEVWHIKYVCDLLVRAHTYTRRLHYPLNIFRVKTYKFAGG